MDTTSPTFSCPTCTVLHDATRTRMMRRCHHFGPFRIERRTTPKRLPKLNVAGSIQITRAINCSQNVTYDPGSSDVRYDSTDSSYYWQRTPEGRISRFKEPEAS